MPDIAMKNHVQVTVTDLERPGTPRCSGSPS